MPDGTTDGTHGEGATKIGEDNPWAGKIERSYEGKADTVSLVVEDSKKGWMLARDRGCDRRGPCLVVVGVVHRQGQGSSRQSCSRRIVSPSTVTVGSASMRNPGTLETFALGQAEKRGSRADASHVMGWTRRDCGSGCC